MMIAANALFLMDTSTTGSGDNMVDNETAEDEDHEPKAEGAKEIPEEAAGSSVETRTGRCLDCCGGGALGVAGGVIAVAWCMTQLMGPLRHHRYEGPVVWTGEGYHCSWMMVSNSNPLLTLLPINIVQQRRLFACGLIVSDMVVVVAHDHRS